jgi:hypothetical protein
MLLVGLLLVACNVDWRPGAGTLPGFCGWDLCGPKEHCLVVKGEHECHRHCHEGCPCCAEGGTGISWCMRPEQCE